MHAYTFKKGSTNVSIELEIIDDTDGTPETGVVWNTAGIDLQYRRDAAASTAITEATLAALTTAHTDGGFLHIGNGVYRFDLPDAALASGADKVVIHGTVTGMIVIPCVIQLVDYDLFDGTRLGLTALPNAAADAAGGLPISDAGGLNLDGALSGNTPQTGDTYALANGTTGFAAIDTVVDGIQADLSNTTDGLGAIKGDSATLVARLTATRAAYLDKLNITGNVAASSEVTAIQNNTRVRVIVPPTMERPDSGSTAFKLHLYLYDDVGNMEAPDSLPTVTAVNEAGTSRSVNLGVVTLESAGHYSVTYTLSSADAIEQLIYEWSVIEGGVTRLHGAAAQVVDTTAVDFTAADRTKLDTLHDVRLTAARAGYLDELAAANLPADIDGLTASLVTAQADLDIITGTDGATLSSASQAAAVIAFWSDTLTTYTDGEAGKRLKGITAVPTLEGTVNDASATTTSFITTLTGYGDDFFNDSLMIVEIATDQWQARPVIDYVSATGTFTFDEAFTSAPANSSAIAVRATHIHPVTAIQSGLATEAKQDVIDSIVDAILVATGTNIPATLATLATAAELATSDGKIDIIDSLIDQLIAAVVTATGEPGQGALPVSASMGVKINYLYKALRNKTEQTDTELSIYNDAGTVVDHKAAVSDDGTTTTKGEMATGP